MSKFFFAVLFSFALASCGSSSNPDSSDGATNSGDGAADSVLTGVFLDSAVEGISYETETLSGTTNESGEFQYLDGESVTFSIGDLVFPAATAMETVTPLDMTEAGSINDNVVVNTTTLLQSLDVDANPDNGIRISEQAAANASVIDLSIPPSDFSQNAAVLNLVANSGSSNTSLISTEDASQHFQTTLVDTGALQSFSRLEYTNLMIGNTAAWATGQTIYYRQDGVKFVRRSEGDSVRSWFLDDSGLLCETIRDESTYCIADANGYLMTRSADSNVYNYNEDGFITTIAISEGDTLGLSSDVPSQ